MLPPERAFWPLCPLVDVLPWPEPTPLPILFLFFVAPKAGLMLFNSIIAPQ
jgi:hypothetical protein